MALIYAYQWKVFPALHDKAKDVGPNKFMQSARIVVAYEINVQISCTITINRLKFLYQ